MNDLSSDNGNGRRDRRRPSDDDAVAVAVAVANAHETRFGRDGGDGDVADGTVAAATAATAAAAATAAGRDGRLALEFVVARRLGDEGADEFGKGGETDARTGQDVRVVHELADEFVEGRLHRVLAVLM